MSKSPVYLQSSLLHDAGFSHAFFTRQGGCSEGVFSSLNFATETGDSEANIEKNLGFAARSLQISSERIFFLKQVHGTASRCVDGNTNQTKERDVEGDIVLTKDRSAAAGVRTADCVPILLGCKASGWVSACHSGWQGCVAGAASQAVQMLRERGATKIIAAIGPHISKESFEISEEVATLLLNASPDKNIVDHSYKKPHVDLRRMVRSQLVQSGIRDEDIDDVHGCTVNQSSLFFSYRRDGNPSGRLLSAIVGGA